MTQLLQKTNRALLRSTLLAAAIWGITDVNAGTWIGGNENGDFAATSNWNGMTGAMNFGTGSQTVSATLSSGDLVFGSFEMASGASNAVLNITGGSIVAGDAPGSTKPIIASGGGAAVVNQSGGTVQLKGRAVTSESKTSSNVRPTSVWNLSGGTLAIGVFSHGSQGAATINISQVNDSVPTIFETYDDLVGSSAFIIGFNGTNEGINGVVNQSGGTANIFSLGTHSWVPSTPGIYFGGGNMNQPSGQWNISGGTLNTLRFSSNSNYKLNAYQAPADSAYVNPDYVANGYFLNITDDAVVNIMKGVKKDGTEINGSGVLNVPAYLAGGELNVCRIETEKTDNLFHQYGGTLSASGDVYYDADHSIAKNPVGTLDIAGSWTQDSDATLRIDLLGSQADRVVVSGTATINGKISVNSMNSNGEYFYGIVLEAGSIADSAQLADGMENWGTFIVYSEGTPDQFVWNAGNAMPSASFSSLNNWDASVASTEHALLYFGTKGRNAAASLADSMNAMRIILGVDSDSSASLTLENGAVLNTNSLVVGNCGAAEMTINSGATLNSGALIEVGVGVGGSGVLNLNTDFSLSNYAFAKAQDSEAIINVGSGATLTIQKDLNAIAGRLAINVQNGSLKINALNLDGKGVPAELNVSAQGTVSGTSLNIGNAAKTSGTLQNDGGALVFSSQCALGLAGKGTFVQTAGTTTFENRLLLGEQNNSYGKLDISGGDLLVKKAASFGSNATAITNLSGGSFTVLGQFVLGFYGGGTSSLFNQSGGTANIWGNVNDGWGLRANPGFMSDYSSNKVAGLQIGNTNVGGALQTISPAQYVVTDGTLNTYRVFDMRDKTNDAIADSIMLEIADGTVNILESSTVSYSGLLATNTRMTGGTLNVARILAVGNRYDNSNNLVSSDYCYMKNGAFVQEGGVLSPDGGSVENNAFVPNESGISSTVVEGDYVLTGTGSVKLDIVSKTDWTQNDSFVVTGDANIGGVGISVNPIGNLTFDVGDSIKLVVADSFSGTTIDRTSGNLGDGYYWASSVQNGDDGAELWGTVASLPCFWNQNASGNFADLSNWSADYASTSEAVFGGAGFNAEAVLNTAASLPTLFMAQDADSSAKLTIANGGSLAIDSDDATGNATDAVVNVGYHGNASVVIQNGGTLGSGVETVNVALLSDSEASIQSDGTLSANVLNLGVNGKASMNVDSGVVSAKTANIGAGNGSVATLTLQNGAEFASETAFNVASGVNSNASAEIHGKLNAATITVGSGTASVGSLTIYEDADVSAMTSLSIGGTNGSATVSIYDKNLSLATLNVGSVRNSKSTLNLSASTLKINQDNWKLGSGTTSDSTLNLADRSALTANYLSVGYGNYSTAALNVVDSSVTAAALQIAEGYGVSASASFQNSTLTAVNLNLAPSTDSSATLDSRDSVKTLSGTFNMATGDSAVATVNLSGNDLLTAQKFNIASGADSLATLNLRDNANVKFLIGSFASNATAETVVNVFDNATLTIGEGYEKNDKTCFGNNGKAVMNIYGGSVVNNDRFFCGEVGEKSIMNEVNVYGGAFIGNGINLFGTNASATLNIAGGKVVMDGQLVLAYGNTNGGTGILNQSGGEAHIWGDVVRRWNDVKNGLGIELGGSGNVASEAYVSLSGGTLNTYGINKVKNCIDSTFTLTGGTANIISKTGSTSALSGTLKVDEIIMRGGTLNVQTIDASLMGGTFTQNGGTLSPDGGSVGEDRLFVENPNRIGSTTVKGSYVLEFTDDALTAPTILLDVASNSASNDALVWDLLNVDGNFTIGDGSILAIRINDADPTNDTLNLIAADSIDGQFSELHLLMENSAIVLDSLEEIAEYLTYSDKYVSFSFNQSLNGLPEPSAWLLMLVGLAGTSFLARRKKKNA